MNDSTNQAINSKMTEWLILERMLSNDLPLPKYETLHSAGVDFPACLTRPQRLVPEAASFGHTVPFFQLLNGTRHELTTIIKSESGPDLDRNVMEYINSLNIAKEVYIYPKETIMISLGYRCEFGKAYVLMLHIRSSIGMMGLELANSTGIIDPDYRGELWAVLHNRNSNKPIRIKHGDRLVQGVMLGFNQAIIEEGLVEKTVRGDGGFGSTGVQAS